MASKSYDFVETCIKETLLDLVLSSHQGSMRKSKLFKHSGFRVCQNRNAHHRALHLSCAPQNNPPVLGCLMILKMLACWSDEVTGFSTERWFTSELWTAEEQARKTSGSSLSQDERHTDVYSSWKTQQQASERRPQDSDYINKNKDFFFLFSWRCTRWLETSFPASTRGWCSKFTVQQALGHQLLVVEVSYRMGDL